MRISCAQEGDSIARTAFDKTIEAWQLSGKNLPLLLDHKSTIVGAIDPHSMHTTPEGLVVAGEVDRESEAGRQVWRQIKAGVLAFSIGFKAESRPRSGGGRELTEVDLFEISVTPTPMNAKTRTLAWKSAAATPTADGPAGLTWPIVPPDHVIRKQAAEIEEKAAKEKVLHAEIMALARKAERERLPIRESVYPA